MFFQQDVYQTGEQNAEEPDANYIYALGFAMICAETGK